MLKVKFQRSYRNEKGTVVFVYQVSGSNEALVSYKSAQASFYREDEVTGQPLWFTVRCIGKAGSLIITSKGKVVPDMSEFDQAKSLVEQYGGNFGETLANSLMSNILGNGSAPKQIAAPTEDIAHEEIPADESTDLDNI